MRAITFTTLALLAAASVQAKTLVVYYSYTNNIERIVDVLRTNSLSGVRLSSEVSSTAEL